MEPNSKQHPKADTVASVHTFIDEELRQIIDMERKLFPESLWDFSYAKDTSTERVVIIAYDPDGCVAGYIFSVPHGEAHTELCEADPRMPNMRDALYIKSIAIRSDLQGKGYFRKLMKKFLEETDGRAITMHARVSNNCSVGMKKHGAMHVYNVENWFGSGERFDYLVIEKRD